MECVAIKTEPLEFEDIKPQVIIGGVSVAAMAEQPTRILEKDKSICGEIFVTNNARKWTFNCTYCKKTTRDIGEFICHIQLKHMQGQYTEEDENGDSVTEEELQPLEIATTSNSLMNTENNILFQPLTINKTIDASQTFPLPTTPTIAQYSDSTNSGDELLDDASTSQQHSQFSPPTSTQNTNRAKRKLDHEEDLNENLNCNTKNEENDEMLVDDENDDFISDDDMESKTLLCVKEEPKITDPTASNIQYQGKHKIKQTKFSPMTCEYCNKDFKTTQALGNHIRTHSKSIKYQCPMCSLCHSTENQFITHVLTHESATCYPCMVCGWELKSNEERDEHLTTHIYERPFGCNFCKRRFRKPNFLTNHLRIHCQYLCDFCSSDFRSMKPQRRPYACPECDEKPDVREKVESQRALLVKKKT